MWPLAERPEEIDRLLAERNLLSDVVLALASDIGPDGQFGEQWLVVTPARTLVLAGGDGEVQVIHDLPTADLRDVRVESEVGGAVLQVRHDGVMLPLIQFSNRLSHEFARAAKGIERLASDGQLGEPPVDDHEAERCPTCGRRLEEYSSVCPVCLKHRKVAARLLGRLRPHWPRVVALFVLMGLTAVAQLVPGRLTRALLDDVLPPRLQPAPAASLGQASQVDPSREEDLAAAKSKPPEEQRKVDRSRESTTLLGRTLQRRQALLVVIFIYVAMMVLGWAFAVAHMRVAGWLGNRVTFELRSAVYQALQRLSLSFYDRRRIGHVMASVTHDTSHLRHLLVDEGPWFIVTTMQVVVIAVYCFILDWRLALWMWVPVPAIVVVTRWVWPWLHRIFRRLWERRARLSGQLSDSLTGIRVVRAFGKEDREIERFEERNVEFFQADLRAVRAFAALMPSMHFIIAIGAPIIWYFGSHQVFRDPETMTAGKLMQFVAYLWIFYHSVGMMTRMVQWVTTSLTATERVFEIIDTEPEVQDAPDARPVPQMKGRVRFDNVTFGYSKLKPVLENISLEVNPGEMLGLVGHSGAGKTTITNLLARFYDVDQGHVTIDGIDIRKIPKDDLHRQMGIVLQETILFDTSVAENIAYAKPDATRLEIMQAAKAANAHDFVVNLPDGYDFQVGERGQRLSAGERQRVAIARAILGNPRILVLDEATASVDTETEAQIQDALTRLVSGRTTFAIAHRLSTLRNADRLLVIEKGHQAEIGTHDELMSKRGVYYRLVKMQRQISRLRAVGG